MAHLRSTAASSSTRRADDEPADSDAKYATTGNSTIEATNIQVVGGVDNPANYKPFVAGDPNPLHARALPEPDPLRNLPTPTASTPGVNTTYRGAYANQ